MIHKDYVYRILKGNFEFWTIRGWGTISDLKAFSQPLGGGSILYLIDAASEEFTK